MQLPDWIRQHTRTAIQDARSDSWSLTELGRQCAAYAAALGDGFTRGRPVGLIADNCAQWIAIDLAAHMNGATLVPLPDFFTGDQLAHAVRATGMHTLLCRDARLARRLGFVEEVMQFGTLGLHARAAVAQAVAGTPVQKITFTSGTTGAPRGVCLTSSQQLQTASALAHAIAPLGITRHLSLLPLPVLLENIAGVYAPLILGATCICIELDAVGLTGASAFDAGRCLDAIAEYAPESVILLPQMLEQLATCIEHSPGSGKALAPLKFVAVGGAKTPVASIARARRVGLPVYEGYGLTECASVVALNVPGADRPGTVGRALHGTSVRIAADGEIEIAGRSFAGYLGAPACSSAHWLPTGDLGAIDADGFLTIVGRKKNVFITSFGRNVSPEWPESLLLESPWIAQAAVYGEGRPCAVAVLVCTEPLVSDAMIEQAIATTNRRLPDYARIRSWIRAAQPFTSRNGLATANGRLRRDAVWARYGDQIDQPHATENASLP